LENTRLQKCPVAKVNINIQGGPGNVHFSAYHIDETDPDKMKQIPPECYYAPTLNSVRLSIGDLTAKLAF